MDEEEKSNQTIYTTALIGPKDLMGSSSPSDYEFNVFGRSNIRRDEKSVIGSDASKSPFLSMKKEILVSLNQIS